MLESKILLFFVISIMSFYITSEKSYAVDLSHIDCHVQSIDRQ